MHEATHVDPSSNGSSPKGSHERQFVGVLAQVAQTEVSQTSQIFVFESMKLPTGQ